MGKRCKALLLAGGLGTRLKPLTDTVPKCLVPIAGKPLIGYWFDRLKEAGVLDLVVNTHHLPDPVNAYLAQVNAEGPLRVTASYEPVLLGSAGTITKNRSLVDDADECLVIYADNLSSVDLRQVLAFHRGHTDPITMMLFHTAYPSQCGIAALDEQGRV